VRISVNQPCTTTIFDVEAFFTIRNFDPSCDTSKFACGLGANAYVNFSHSPRYAKLRADPRRPARQGPARIHRAAVVAEPPTREVLQQTAKGHGAAIGRRAPSGLPALRQGHHEG
jgi:hypothetical protein